MGDDAQSYRFRFYVGTEAEVDQQQRDQWRRDLLAGDETPDEAAYRLRVFELERGNIKAVTCDAIECDRPGYALLVTKGSPSGILHGALARDWSVPNGKALEVLHDEDALSSRAFVLCREHHPEGETIAVGGASWIGAATAAIGDPRWGFLRPSVERV